VSAPALAEITTEGLIMRPIAVRDVPGHTVEVDALEV
jgi:hypothetical protein